MNMQNIHDLAMFRFNLWHKPFFSPPAAHQQLAQGMENSSFVPNPLGTPALMVLASTAENHEGARVPGPHRFPIQDKDAPAYSNAFTMYRPGEHFAPPLYAPVHPFVRPGMERGVGVGIMNAAGGSAFRPVSTESVESYHSAFSPAKRGKLEETVSQAGFAGTENDRNESEDDRDHADSALNLKSERPTSLSSNYDTNSETHSDSGEFERGTPDSEGRNLRKQRKRSALDGQSACCPICGLTLRAGEVEPHLAQELDRLEKVSRPGRKSRDTTPQGRKTLPSPSGRRGKDSPSLETVAQSRYDTYLRIHLNRQARLSARSRNRKKKTIEETVCPVCNDKLVGTPEELNDHVELCLKKQRGGEGEEESVDIEGDGEQYEEYTWAGQTRIRVTSMLDGGFAGSGFQTSSSSSKVQEEDVDLNVDGDDSEQYGKPQYSEVDVIPCCSDEPDEDKERQALRGAVLSISDTPAHASHSNTDIEGAHNMEVQGDDPGPSKIDSSDDIDSESVGGSAGEIITALRSKLKERDAVVSKHKCLICMEAYKKPLTSIQCWHVHCEECWLKTLGAKKLCPQCNMITSPADLRRIFL